MRVLVAGLIGGIVMFIWGVVAHMALGLGSVGIHQPLNENAALSGLQEGLGDQLPAGTLRFYLRDKRGDPQFIGESAISHTPMGSDLSLATGDAFDVKVKPVVEQRERLGLFRWRTTMHYTLTNALPRSVTVDLLQDGLWGDTRIVSETTTSERQSADVAKWRVSVPANGSAEVRAVFDSRY